MSNNALRWMSGLGCFCLGIGAMAYAADSAKPLWVSKGGGSYRSASAPVFLGTGVGNPLAQEGRRNSMADQRARLDLEYSIRSGVKSLTKDYMLHHLKYFNIRDTAGAEEFSNAVSKRVAAELAAGSVVVDRWRDPRSKMLFSLARLDSGDRFYASYKKILGSTLCQRHCAFIPSDTSEALAELDQAVLAQRARQDQVFGAKEAVPTQASVAFSAPR
jgi:hypothetical protein